VPSCPELANATGRCSTHTRPAWRNTDRKATLPRDWKRIREFVLLRDGYRCRCPGCGRCLGSPCMRRARSVDHIGDRNDHGSVNLRAMCDGAGSCHALRSSQQGRLGATG
jgi:hypothetical protein